jgi:hypothetical protein
MLAEKIVKNSTSLRMRSMVLKRAHDFTTEEGEVNGGQMLDLTKASAQITVALCLL